MIRTAALITSLMAAPVHAQCIEMRLPVEVCLQDDQLLAFESQSVYRRPQSIVDFKLAPPVPHAVHVNVLAAQPADEVFQSLENWTQGYRQRLSEKGMQLSGSFAFRHRGASALSYDFAPIGNIKEGDGRWGAVAGLELAGGVLVILVSSPNQAPPAELNDWLEQALTAVFPLGPT